MLIPMQTFHKDRIEVRINKNFQMNYLIHLKTEIAARIKSCSTKAEVLKLLKKQNPNSDFKFIITEEEKNVDLYEKMAVFDLRDLPPTYNILMYVK